MGATIKLEEYFEFIDSDDIRIKGSRIGIESILYEYIHREQAPEAIHVRFPTLTLGANLRSDSLLFA